MLNADHQTVNALVNALCGVAVLISVYALYRAFAGWDSTKFRSKR